jgi:hypothetical protein
MKLASYLEVLALSDSRKHDIYQTRREGFADVNKDHGTYCSSLALVPSHGISQSSGECRFVEFPVEGVFILDGASCQLQGFAEVVDGNGDRVHLALEVEIDGLNRSRRPINESPFEVDINS